jgi:spore maturation protein CgeB
MDSCDKIPLQTLVVGDFHEDSFASHIAHTLRKMGHFPVEYRMGDSQKINANPIQRHVQKAKSFAREATKSIAFVRRQSIKRLKRCLRSNEVDLTIVCHDFLAPDEVKLIQDESQSPVALWFPDAIVQFGRSFFLVAKYDRLFFKDPYVVFTISQKLDIPIYYLPECCNPDVHRACELSSEDHSVYDCELTTAGNLYSYRVAFLRQLAQFDLKVWGTPPPRWLNAADMKFVKSIYQCRYVANQDKCKAFRAAKIVLNSLHPAEVWGINARAFEIAAVGGFQLIDSKPGLGQLFEDGKELVAFNSREELIEKCNHYLTRECERREIAERGMRRAHADHTYEKRLRLLIESVFGSKKGFPIPQVST